MLAAPLYGKILRFFPKVVTGSVVTIIGLSLIPVAMTNVGGGDTTVPEFGSSTNLLLALTTFVVILLINRVAKGFMRSISVLIGLVVGTVIGYFMGVVDFSRVGEASWFNIVQPFYFGTPQISLVAVVTMILVNIVSMVKSTGEGLIFVLL